MVIGKLKVSRNTLGIVRNFGRIGPGKGISLSVKQVVNLPWTALQARRSLRVFGTSTVVFDCCLRPGFARNIRASLRVPGFRSTLLYRQAVVEHIVQTLTF